jgi:hypothetical protein
MGPCGAVDDAADAGCAALVMVIVSRPTKYDMPPTIFPMEAMDERGNVLSGGGQS